MQLLVPYSQFFRLFFKSEAPVRSSLLLVIFVSLLMGCAHNTVIPLHDKSVPDDQLVRLVLPEEVDLVMLDGKKLTGFSRPPLEVSYMILPGEHELVLRYEHMWPNDEYTKEVVTSPFLSVSVNMTAGTEYRLSNALPQDYRQARVFIKNPEFEISSASGKVSAASKLPPSQQSLGMSDLLSGRNNTPLNNLTFWWEKASEAEKVEFLQRIQEKRGQ